ncbi:MAG TPA: AsmA family protein [Spirochaetota bacterium]|nr:AsmA family protein [Spirochaetota bacterium]HPI90797.1 AsmA family protein [Spirochaetota bacterium]HPR48936.1 AsmA family protein [Spirochaetota bacterium]
MKSIKTKIFKILISLIGIVLLIIGLLAGLFIYFFPKEKIKAIAIEQARKTINRELTVEDIRYSLSGIILDNIEILNKTGNDVPEEEKIFARADSIYLRFSVLDLLEKKIKFSYIYLENFRFNIIFDEQGQSNLEQLVQDLTRTTGDPGVSASISNIKLNNAEITLKKAPEILRPLEGTYYLSGRLQFTRSGDILVADSELRLPEDRGTMLPELTVHTGKGGFKIIGNVELKKTSLLWVYQWATNPKPYNLITGNITDLTITTEAVEGFVKASSTLTNSKHLLYADGFCRVSIKDRTVLIANTKGKINNSTLWFNYLQFSFSGTNVKFDAKNIDAQVTDVIPLVDVIPGKLYGKMEGELSYGKGIFNTKARVSNAGYDFPGKTISGVSTDLTIINNQFKKSDIAATVLGQPCTVSIASTDRTLNRMFLNIVAEKFVFPDKKESDFQDLDLSFPLEVTGQAKINQFIFKDYIFSGLEARYLLSGKKLTLNTLTTGFMEGTVRGNATIDTTVSPPLTSAQLAFDSVKLHRLFAQSKLFNNRFYGNISGNANVTLLLRENILDTIKGKTEFTVEKGKITNTGIQNGLGIWLAELKYKIIDLEFNKIYGNIDISGPHYVVNSFIFNSQNIRFNIKGSFNRDLVAEPLFINMEFSKYFIQDIARPLVVASGYTKYLKGDWYYIPFQVSGDLTNSKNIKKIY